MDNNKLIPINSSVALAKTSVALSLTDKLTFNQNRKLVKEIFLSNREFFISSISKFYPLNDSLMEKYKNEWFWDTVSWNKNIKWTIYLIDKYSDCLNWILLSSNSGIPWSEKLIDNFVNKWHFKGFRFSLNETFPWSERLVEKYKDLVKLDLNKVPKDFYQNENFVFENLDRLNECNVSQYINENLFKKLFVISEFDFCWKHLSLNKVFQWSEQFIDKYFVMWDWEMLSRNESLPWSIELIEKYIDEWDWEGLSLNLNLPWSIELIEKYVDKWDWEKLSSNVNLSWSIELIEKYINKWSWEVLSVNSGLQFSDTLINKYFDKWYFKKLSCNRALSISNSYLELNSDKWDWEKLSQNENTQWSEIFIETYKDKWDWDGLFYNYSIKWNLRMLIKFLMFNTNNVVSLNVWNSLKSFIDDNLIEEVFEELNSEIK